jgi:CBS domain containing-hemolysin-like protein
MMPKSWAITHPERSATLLALPFRAFTRVAGPALRALNALANLALRPFGVHPQDQLAHAHGPAEMRILLDRSEAEGSLASEQTQLLGSMLELGSLRVRDLLVPADQLITVPASASAADVELASMTSGRSRLAVTASPAPAGSSPAGSFPAGSFPAGSFPAGSLPAGDAIGFVHVREAVRATTAGRDATAGELMDPAFELDASVTVMEAVTAMRAGRAQLAIVTSSGAQVGFVALEDLLEQVIGRFDDETDPVPVA